MRAINIKNIMILGGFAIAMVFGMTVNADAQTRREIERERQRIAKQYAKDVRRDLRQRRKRVERSRDRRTVNAVLYHGYQQGIMAGRADRRADKYNRFNVYRNTGSRPNSGDPTSYDYLYRQGYLEGYEDGFRGRERYRNDW